MKSAPNLFSSTQTILDEAKQAVMDADAANKAAASSRESAERARNEKTAKLLNEVVRPVFEPLVEYIKQDLEADSQVRENKSARGDLISLSLVWGRHSRPSAGLALAPENTIRVGLNDQDLPFVEIALLGEQFKSLPCPGNSISAEWLQNQAANLIAAWIKIRER